MTLTNLKTVVAIGKFDGLHQGHQKLLKTASGLAKEAGLVSVCYIIAPKGSPVIIPDKKREEIIKSHAIDRCITRELTPDFMNMSPESFVRDILIGELGCAHVVVGYNFRFGKDRCADAAYLEALCRENGLECSVIPEVKCHVGGKSCAVSSSEIKKHLSLGDVQTASAILGRAYTISGRVAEGKKIGRTIDFPTANIIPDSGLFLPKNGVYATEAIVGTGVYPSVTNIGDNPTVNSRGNITVETHIIGYDGDIYGQELTIEFKYKIREQKRFDSVDDLKKQIQQDIENLK